jgi:hypothetical protein
VQSLADQGEIDRYADTHHKSHAEMGKKKDERCSEVTIRRLRRRPDL